MWGFHNGVNEDSVFWDMTQYLLVDIKDSVGFVVFIFRVDKEKGHEHFNSLLVS
jgi:hypothetical protein